MTFTLYDFMGSDAGSHSPPLRTHAFPDPAPTRLAARGTIFSADITAFPGKPGIVALAESAYPGARRGGDGMAGSGPREAARNKGMTARTRFISAEEAARIVDLVRAWPSLPFTWDAIRDQIGRDVLGIDPRRKTTQAKVWSRQALSANPSIKRAYEDRRRELTEAERRGVRRPRRSRDPETVVLRRQVDALTIENKTLREQLAAYEDRFRTMAVNRALGATTDAGLLEPLSVKLDRRPKDE